MTAVLTDKLLAIIRGCKIPVGSEVFFLAEGLTDYVDIAIVASEEKTVDELLIKPMATSGVKFETLSAKVSIRKLWMLCRNTLDHDVHVFVWVCDGQV